MFDTDIAFNNQLKSILIIKGYTMLFVTASTLVDHIDPDSAHPNNESQWS